MTTTPRVPRTAAVVSLLTQQQGALDEEFLDEVINQFSSGKKSA
jgi:hypothetical protein